MYPFDPGSISKDPLSRTKFIVLVRSAVVARAIPKNSTVSPGGLIK